MPSYRSRLARPHSRVLVGVAAGSLVLAAAGCGSSDDAGGGGGGELSASQQECMDNANAYLDERGLLPESLPEELTPLSKPPAEGLTITRVGPAAVPTSLSLSERLVEIAPEIGWTGSGVTYDGSVEDLNRKALEAVSSSDVVVLDGLPTAALQAPIQAAKDNGVLLLIASINEVPQSVPGFGGTPYGGDMSPNLGELGAYAFMQATDCQGTVANFEISGYPAQEAIGDSLEEVLARECEDCSYSSTGINQTDIGSPAATNAVVSKLQSDPSIDFAFFTFGDLAVGLGPALTQAGIDVQIGGAYPNTQNLEAMQKAGNGFWLGVPEETNAYVIVDTAARALDSGQPVVDSYYPIPVYTPDNLETTDEVPAYPTDIAEQYKELWQVG
jgi:ABC-type sugar transport system substrate-binding protein